MDIDPQLLIAILSSASVTAVIGAVVQFFANRKKLGADVTEVITRAASGVLKDMESTLDRKTAEMVEQEQRHVAALSAMQHRHDAEHAAWMSEHAEWMALAADHGVWDRVIRDKLIALGVADVPEPPPLTISKR